MKYLNSTDQILTDEEWRTGKGWRQYSLDQTSLDILSEQMVGKIVDKEKDYRHFFTQWLIKITAYLNHPSLKTRSAALISLNSFVESLIDREGKKVQVFDDVVEDCLQLARWKYADPSVRPEATALKETLLKYKELGK